MERRKLKITLSLAVLIPCVLYIAGIIAQFMININAWKAAGSDYSVSPGLPSLELADVFQSIFHFPEGLIAIGMVVVGIVLICIFGLRIGWGQNGVTDSDRNLTVSSSGSYGTASFMSPKEASACFDVTSAKKTEQDILGMLPDGQILTLPKNTRLNSNLAVCGSSGTGKSRSISRNLVLQAVKRGESLILTDPKSELYESMSEYLRDNGYTVKVFNLIEMDHSDSWNCLNEVGSSELMAQTFADIVLQNTSGDSKDAFWYNAELNLLKALVLYVALEMPPEQRNLATVYDLLYTQTEKGLSDIMASISHEHVNQYTGELLPPSPAAAPYAIFKQSSDTVRTSVIIGLGSKLAVLQAQQVRNITSYNEIDLELPGKQKCAYFCIVSDQDSTFDFLSSLFFSFLFIRLIRYADGYCEGGMLSTKVKFVLDEFPNCCLIPDFTKKCSTIRSRGCSVTYLGTEIVPVEEEPTFNGSIVVIPVIGGTILLATLLLLGLLLRKNTTVYKATGKGNEYEKCGRLRLKTKDPELRIDRLKDIPEGMIAVEVDQAVAKKLFGQTIAIHCYDNTVEHTVGTVNGQYWFKVDIGTQEGEPDTEEEPV